MTGPQLGDVVDAYVPTRTRRHRLIWLGESAGGMWPWRLLDANSDPEGCGIGTDNVKNVRLLLSPLKGSVVIDPEDREQVQRLLNLIDNTDHDIARGSASRRVDTLATALRKFANPTPPKPAEPTGLGAVVLDADGDCWANLTDPKIGRHDRHWMNVSNPTRWLDYAEINVVRVLSEGVTP